MRLVFLVRTLLGPLTFCATAALAVATAAHADAAPFSFETVARIASDRSREPYQGAGEPLPADLQALDYDGYRDIRFQPARALWRDARLPFEAMFFHLGQYQRAPVRVHEVTADGARWLRYQRMDFSFGKNRVQPQTWGDLGFAGLRIHYPLNTPQYKDELVTFLGASYFRALGAGQQYGLSARGWPSTPPAAQAKNSPRFTEFWLERPAPGAQQLTLFALLESPRATGAYRFDVCARRRIPSRACRLACSCGRGRGRSPRWASHRSPACSCSAKTSRARATFVPRCTTRTAC